jgi:ABC-2 type transport system ATP-binding protein
MEEHSLQRVRPDFGLDQNEAPHRPAGEFRRADVLLGLCRFGVVAFEPDHQVVSDDPAGHVAIHQLGDPAEHLGPFLTGFSSGLQQALIASLSMIEVTGITKSYGDKVAVRDLSFKVRPGIVTGFLGPNGSGKSTTMRLILGLDNPDAGETYVNGKHYRDHPAPLRQVGALLEAKSVHTGRSAHNHLLALAQTHGIGRQRVSELIEMVGLEEVAKKRAGSFSLGMGQRLGIASALLGDPRVVMLDEPVNGLDPEGILWVRNLLKKLAAEGRTVFVSSHLMSEMALTAEHLIVIGRGELIADMGVDELVRGASNRSVRVRSPQATQLAELVAAADVSVRSVEPSVIEITGLDAEQIGLTALANQIVLFELTPREASLEEAFMELTGDAVEFQADLPDRADQLQGTIA